VTLSSHAPLDVVIEVGAKADSCHFLTKGAVVISADRSDPSADLPWATQRSSTKDSDPVMMRAPSWLGDMCLFRPATRSVNVIAHTYCLMVDVHRDCVESMVETFPSCQGVYREWTDKVRRGDINSIGIKCTFCGMLGHNPADCREVHAALSSAAEESASGRFLRKMESVTLPPNVLDKLPGCVRNCLAKFGCVQVIGRRRAIRHAPRAQG